ncbi:hypothetical protein ACK8HH_17020 [Gordonia sp. LUNF6]|uniref:hypothetical protein n=1 Tax=Gordonia sp. LUNF6 TaxID=3388658 RepID=UPI00399C1C0B
MLVTLHGGPHDGRIIDADTSVPLRLPVLMPGAGGEAPELGEIAAYAPDDGGVWRYAGSSS